MCVLKNVTPEFKLLHTNNSGRLIFKFGDQGRAVFWVNLHEDVDTAYVVVGSTWCRGLTLTKEAQNKRRSFLERCHSFTFLTGAASHMMEWSQCRLVVRGYPVVMSAGLPSGS